MHLFSSDAPPVDATEMDVARAPLHATVASSTVANRLSDLENELRGLKKEVTDIHQQLSAFRKQFE